MKGLILLFNLLFYLSINQFNLNLVNVEIQILERERKG